LQGRSNQALQESFRVANSQWIPSAIELDTIEKKLAAYDRGFKNPRGTSAENQEKNKLAAAKLFDQYVALLPKAEFLTPSQRDKRLEAMQEYKIKELDETGRIKLPIKRGDRVKKPVSSAMELPDIDEINPEKLKELARQMDEEYLDELARNIYLTVDAERKIKHEAKDEDVEPILDSAMARAPSALTRGRTERELSGLDDVQGGYGKSTSKPRNNVSTLPHGVTNWQIDKVFADEPRYIGTISRDQVKNLGPLIRHAIDQYGECGFIMNLDKLDQQDYEHWVAFFIDADHSKAIYYYDPFGEPLKFKEPITDLHKIISSLKLPYYLGYYSNDTKNQNYNSNRCGIFTIMFIQNMLDGMSFQRASSAKEPDAMHEQKILEGHGYL